MKQPLLILHGAIGASRQFKLIAEKLATHYDVHLFDFPGHGGQPLPNESFSIAFFAEATAAYIQKNKLQNLTVFGYSMGGYVAMYLAKQHPGIITKIATLGTKFHWDEITSAKEVKMLNPDAIEAKVPAFAATLKDLHAPQDWKEIVQRTATMLSEMGKNNPLHLDDYKEITIPCLVMLGDRDKMVTLEETSAVYKQLPNAQMALLPGTPHVIEQVDADLISYFLERLINRI